MKENIIKGAAGAGMSTITYFIGAWDTALMLLIFSISVDFTTGLLHAWKEKNLNSQVCAEGIIKKIMCLAMVVVANIVDISLKANGWIREAVIYFFIANELLSITENAARSGLPIPSIIVEKLEQLRGKGEQDEDKD